MFIMVDGIDGSGKSTVLSVWRDYLAGEGKNVMSIKDFCATHQRLPQAAELMAADVIVSAEPTTTWIGAAIREEMIQAGSSYSTRAMAEAYALDRLVLYRRVLLPLMKQNKLILQDRGVSTSLCYQSVQDDPLPLATTAAFEGNALALKERPDHLVLLDTPVDQALNRLHHRTGKQDGSIFERKNFLERARGKFLDPDYQHYFSRVGAKIHVLSSGTPLAIMNEEAIALLKQCLS